VTGSLREQADEAERAYEVTVSARFGFLCARMPGVPGAHWDAGDGPQLMCMLAAAGVPRRGSRPPPRG
jgi:hypothetical protein